jgi:hypothetical protein
MYSGYQSKKRRGTNGKGKSGQKETSQPMTQSEGTFAEHKGVTLVG